MADLSREESNRMRSIGRETAARIARIAETAARSYGMSRSFATVTKVNSDGTVEVDFGNSSHAMSVGSIRTTTDCAGVRVGDVVVVDTFAYVPLVTGVVSTGKNGVLPVSSGGTGQTSLQATRNAMGLGNTTGALPIANGGTGANTASAAFKNLSGYTLDIGTNNTTDTWVPVMNGSTIQHRVIPALPLPVSSGGTGATNAAQARANLGLGSASIVQQACGINGGSTYASDANAATTPGRYTINPSTKNIPSGAVWGILTVVKAQDWIQQTIVNNYTSAGKICFTRTKAGTQNWSAWQSLAATDGKSLAPVYRLYNQYNSQHLFVSSESEYNSLVSQGWTGEGIVFYAFM